MVAMVVDLPTGTGTAPADVALAMAAMAAGREVGVARATGEVGVVATVVEEVREAVGAAGGAEVDGRGVAGQEVSRSPVSLEARSSLASQNQCKSHGWERHWRAAESPGGRCLIELL